MIPANYTHPDDEFGVAAQAASFARAAHAGQLDDTGADYFKTHVGQVAALVRSVSKDPEIEAAAWLHDTVEDCGVTFDDLRQFFPERVVGLVRELTHEGQKDAYGYYFPYLESRDAIIIKFADRLSNLSRMEAWDDKRRKQYLSKSKFWKGAPTV